MAFSDLHQPIRSISLPSRIHSPSVQLEAAFANLTNWQTLKNSVCSGPDSLVLGLTNLAELYNCVHELIQISPARNSLIQNQNGNQIVEEALDASVTLLDSCDAARNIVLTMREQIQNLQSALRRKGRSDSAVQSHVYAYFDFRKTAKKEISKRIVALKRLETKDCFSMLIVNADSHQDMILKVLRDATRISISIFRSVLVFLSTPAFKTRSCGFSMISKLGFLRPSEKGQKPVNEVQNIDLVLSSINGDSKIELKMVKKMLESLENSSQCLETGLDLIFRCLVQNRVLFLNILTNNC